MLLFFLLTIPLAVLGVVFSVDLSWVLNVVSTVVFMLVVVNVESVVYAVEYDIVIDADGVVDAAAVDVSVVVIVVVDGDVVSVFGTISP